MASGRNIFFDAVKGILIILVVLGHCLQYGFGDDYSNSNLFFDDMLFRTIYSFHMPLFMLISGYFFNPKGKNHLQYLRKRFQSIGIPLVFYAVLSIFIQQILSHTSNLFSIHNFVSTLIFGLWFLSSILLNCILVVSFEAISKMIRHDISILLMFLFAVTIFFIPDQFFPATHKFMYPYFLCGYLIKRHRGTIEMPISEKYQQIVVVLLFTLCVWLFRKDLFVYTTGFIPQASTFIEQEQFIRCMLRFMIGFVGSFCFLAFCASYKDVNGSVTKVMAAIGQETLAIYGLQGILITLMGHLFHHYNLNFSYNYILPIMETVVFLILCVGIIGVVKNNKFTALIFTGKKPVQYLPKSKLAE